MSMREKYTKPGAQIHYFVVEWDLKKLSWKDFRGQVLGATDPVDSAPQSMRGLVLARWEVLGLPAQPNVGDNGVHGSASPFEALVERNNWLGVDIATDPFGAALLKAGLTLEQILEYRRDPQVTFNGQKLHCLIALRTPTRMSVLHVLEPLREQKEKRKLMSRPTPLLSSSSPTPSPLRLLLSLQNNWLLTESTSFQVVYWTTKSLRTKS